MEANRPLNLCTGDLMLSDVNVATDSPFHRLRNALDDIDGSIMQHVCVALGKPGKMLWSWFCSREPLRGSECAAA